MDIADLIALAEQEHAARKPVQVRVCTSESCLSSGARGVRERLDAAVALRNLGDRVQVCDVGCLRLCGEGPLVRTEPGGGLYQRVTAEQASSIVAALDGGIADATPCDPSGPFFVRQRSIVLENCGVIEPERIESYIAVGGYRPLHQALREMTPAQVVDAIIRSGLRGRGGAGYPTGVKWATVAKMPGPQKYVVGNADEGDPGAFMDRCILESDPHRVLEGMAIAGYAVGATQGYIYVRGERRLVIERIDTALNQARRLGVLGSGPPDSPFAFRIDLRIGAGAYVCGEETALMASIEGGRGTPRPRPPYPAESGLWGCPTLINNVETLANIPAILREGPEWFAGIGTGRSKGTKVFALAGKVRHSGLVEVPMGMTLRELVELIGGGPPDGSTIKAVQTGGPSGGCIPAEHLDTPVDYESLKSLGSIMGSGGMIVMDQSDDMVGVARYFMEFCRDESCGKCIPCRVGTVQMHRLLQRIGDGVASHADLEVLERLCDMVRDTSLCGLGQSAPTPVLSTLRYFRHEYESRLVGEYGRADGTSAPSASGPKPPAPSRADGR